MKRKLKTKKIIQMGPILKRVLLICCAFCISITCFPQLQADIQTPKIVPPSPDAAALGKYGEIPVDKSTGIPDISIPLYEIKTPRFNLPISLSYHASGIKVEEISSWVGAGWSLNAGGVITRSVLGLPDDGPLGYLNNTIKKAANIQWPGDINYIADVLNKRLDTDPDNFFYNFNNHSGSFVFGDDKKPLLIPYKPLKINFSTASKDFNLTDEDGNTYSFTAKENMTSQIPNMACISSWYLTQMISADLSDTINFIYTTDTNPQIQYSFNFSQSISSDGVGPYSLKGVMTTPTINQYYSVRISSILFKGGKLDFIVKNGRLDDGTFSLDSIIVSSLNPATNQYRRIKSFKLLQDYFYSTWPIPSNYPIAITEADKHRLKLTGIQENDANNNIIASHQFDYNATVLPQVHSFAQDKWGYFNGQTNNLSLLESRNVVIYPNGTDGVMATIGMDGQIDKGANRNVSSAFMQAGVLTKITYPTKGYTVFAYENNQQETVATITGNFSSSATGLHQENVTSNYTPTNDMIASGGNTFHIKLNKGDATGMPLPFVKVVRVSDGYVMYTLTADPNTAIDKYIVVNISNVPYQLTAVAQGGSSPTSNNLPYAFIGTTCQIPSGADLVDAGGLRIKTISNYNSDGSLVGKETYYYGNNDESGGGVQLAFLPTYHYSHGCYNMVHYTDNDGHLICSFPQGYIDTYSDNSIYPLSVLNSAPVAYPSIKIYQGDSLQNIGKSIYKYTIYPDSIMPVFGDNVSTVKPISVLWKNGEPTWEGHYRNNGSNQYLLVQDKSYVYNIIGRKEGVGTTIGYVTEPIGFTFDNPSIRQDGNVSAPSQPCGDVIWQANQLYWYDYPISTGSRLLAQSIINSYAPDGVTKVANTTNYYYDNLNHAMPTRIATITSTGDTRYKHIRYPEDMVIAGKDPAGIYASMVTANMISPQIEVIDSLNTTQLLKSTTNYAKFNTTLIEPQSLVLQNKTNNPETRLQYLSYDTKGNLQSVTKDDGPKASYVWGYNKAYPVAMALNATANDIFYESFEDGNGNSLADDSKTGHYSHSGSYSKTLSGLDNGSYTLSYWQKSGTTWTLNKSAITVSGGSYTISLSAQIDDVCFYPATAQFSTYRYDPLIGVTSQTDPNSRITYYQYDAFNRLILIRDKDNNIIKKICYNYAGQPENCSMTQYSNVVKSGTYTKNNCSSGTGTTVIYTVPAGTYTSFTSQADADQQAQTDVNTNGQNYANTNGGCTVTGSFAMSSGYISTYTTISSTTVGTTKTASYNLTFYPTNTMAIGTEYMITTVSTNCRPVSNKSTTLFYGGRSYYVTFYASTGLMGVRPISGTNVPGYTSINLTGSFDQTY